MGGTNKDDYPFQMRPISDGYPESVPYSVLWRGTRQIVSSLQADYLREKQTAEIALSALAAIGEEVFRIRKSTQECSAEEHSVLKFLDELFSDIGLKVEVPEAGAPYQGELVEQFENVAQVPESFELEGNLKGGFGEGLRIAEILSPAISYKESLIRMGKSVVAVPVESNSSGEVKGGGDERGNELEQQ